VLTVARSGATVVEIAVKRYMSEGTVRNCMSAAMAKTSARNRLDALRVADERGLL
jgi:two-component system response regulator DesR